MSLNHVSAKHACAPASTVTQEMCILCSAGCGTAFMASQ